jgi:hypothetical protein
MTYPNWPWVTFWLPFGLAAGAEMALRNLERRRREEAALPVETSNVVARAVPDRAQALSRIAAR